MEWQVAGFSQLDSYTVYAMLQLRVDVFVVEQNCPYPELDNKDLHPQTRHILLKKGDKIRLMATGAVSEVLDIGIFKPDYLSTDELSSGEIGYIVTGFKQVGECRVGADHRRIGERPLRHVEHLPAQPLAFRPDVGALVRQLFQTRVVVL